MTQMTLRAPDELLERVRRAASERRVSVNEFVTRILDAATNPELAGSEAERLRARLEAAGLDVTPATHDRVRPPAAELAAARRAAGRGTLLSDIVSTDRG